MRNTETVLVNLSSVVRFRRLCRPATWTTFAPTQWSVKILERLVNGASRKNSNGAPSGNRCRTIDRWHKPRHWVSETWCHNFISKPLKTFVRPSDPRYQIEIQRSHAFPKRIRLWTANSKDINGFLDAFSFLQSHRHYDNYVWQPDPGWHSSTPEDYHVYQTVPEQERKGTCRQEEIERVPTIFK